MAGIKDLAGRLAKTQKALSVPKAEEIIKDLFEIINDVVEDDKVQIKNFGVFKLKHKEARIGRNPKTGEDVKIPAKDVLTFKESK